MAHVFIMHSAYNIHYGVVVPEVDPPPDVEAAPPPVDAAPPEGDELDDELDGADGDAALVELLAPDGPAGPAGPAGPGVPGTGTTVGCDDGVVTLTLGGACSLPLYTTAPITTAATRTINTISIVPQFALFALVSV